MAKHVYILGAGYSRSSYPDFKSFTRYYEPYGYTFNVNSAITGDYSEIHKGAPLTNELLSAALCLDVSQLSLHPKEKATFEKSRDVIRSWLAELNLDDYQMVNIQDVLTHLDMKLSKHNDRYEELSRIKYAMANLVSMLLYARLGHSSQDLDRDFVNYLSRELNQLQQQEDDSEIIIINLNWDLVIDNALKKAFGSSLYELPPARSGTFLSPHEFSSTTYEAGAVSIRLIKPHGSLNWLWCRGCETTVVFEGDEITRYILPFTEDHDDIHCLQCNARQFYPIMVTPSLYRNVFHGSQPEGPTTFQSFLLSLWDRLEQSIEGLTELTIIGYSMPNEDKELRYYLREAIINSPNFSRLRIITGYPKPDPTSEELNSENYNFTIRESNQWKNYRSFFGSQLERSYKDNRLNFWICGFYSYFRRFLS